MSVRWAEDRRIGGDLADSTNRLVERIRLASETCSRIYFRQRESHAASFRAGSSRGRAERGGTRQLTVEPPRRDQVERYLSPRPDTAFPLEYSFSLLGDIRGKTILDFGCGSGENIVPLVERGARVIGIDISPDHIELARQRLALAGLEATLQVVSGYDTGLPDASVDVLFCIALIHHLDIEQVRREMLRILARDGKIILQEPVFPGSTAVFATCFPIATISQKTSSFDTGRLCCHR